MGSELYNAVLDRIIEFQSENSTVADSNKHLLQVTSQNNTILHVAAKLGKTKNAENIVHSKPSLLYETNIKGDTALHIASRLGHLEMILLLINKAKEGEVEEGRKLVRMVNLKEDTALHEAVRHGQYEAVKLLIQEDVELACFVNRAGESPLFLAVDRGCFGVALPILEAAPRCSYAGSNGMNVLHAAIIRMHRSNHYFTSTDEETFAKLWNFSRIYRFIRAGSQVPQSKHELSNCKLGINGADFVGKVLKSCPSSMVETDDYGRIPLHYAAILGNVEAVKLFLKNDSSLAYQKDQAGMSPLHMSAAEGHVDIVRKLITKCPETIELWNEGGETALHVAVYFRRRNVVEFFRQTPFFPYLINEQDNEGNTALHLAAQAKDFKTLAMLADDQRIDKGAVNNDGMTVIDIIQSSIKHEELHCFTAKTILMLEKNGALPSLLSNFIKQEKAAAQSSSSNRSNSEIMKEENRGKEQEIRDAISINLLVATIIATVTFTAAIAMPGGYDKGTAFSWKRIAFKGFILLDSLSFGCSAASMMIHFLVGSRRGPKAINYPYRTVNILTELSALGMVISFVLALLVVLPGKSGLAPLAVTCVLSTCLMPYVCYGMWNTWLRTYYIYQVQRKPSRPFISFVGALISYWKRAFGFD